MTTDLTPAATVGTGYGRARLPFPKEQIRSEILCHGLGAHAIFPDTRTVLDIGGQDTKAIQVDADGIVTGFQMNDRCAAGLWSLPRIHCRRDEPRPPRAWPACRTVEARVKINSTCTVFAGAELREWLSLGEKREDILAGLHRAIVLRAMSLLARSGGVIGSNSRLLAAWPRIPPPCAPSVSWWKRTTATQAQYFARQHLHRRPGRGSLRQEDGGLMSRDRGNRRRQWGRESDRHAHRRHGRTYVLAHVSVRAPSPRDHRRWWMKYSRQAVDAGWRGRHPLRGDHGRGRGCPLRNGTFLRHDDPRSRCAVPGARHQRGARRRRAPHAGASPWTSTAACSDYKMTSQCASGSGQFLENIARYLGVSHDEIGSPVARGNEAGKGELDLCRARGDRRDQHGVARDHHSRHPARRA